MNKDKKKVWHFLICIGLLCVIFFTYEVVMRTLKLRIKLCDDDFSWVYQVDSAKIDDDEFVLNGFAFQLGKDAIEGEYEIVLQEIGSRWQNNPRMEYYTRNDVNDYFFSEYNYVNSGFEARFKEKKLDLEKKNYEVLLRIEEQKKAYETGIYISEGKLVYTNPEEYTPLDVAGTFLEEIVENGVLRVYRPERGIYVYQYEQELYWIAEQDYSFVDGDTFVQCQLETTQIDRLPKHRLENQWYWDNIGFWFSSNEINEVNTGKYRVSKQALPKEYSVCKILTGNCIDYWVWEQNFRPYYNFND